MQNFSNRNQNGRAYDRAPDCADAAKHGDHQCLRRHQHAEHRYRRDHQQHHGVKRADRCGNRAAGGNRFEFPGVGVDACGFGGGLVLLDGQQGHAKARQLDTPGQQHGGQQHAQSDKGVNARVRELHIGQRLLAHHGQRHFLVAQPLEHIQHGQRIGQHGQRKVVAAQPESRYAYGDAGDAAEQRRQRNQQVRRQAEMHLPQRTGVSPQTEKSGVAERHQAGVTAQQVPGQTKAGPDQHHGQYQLVISIRHQRGQHGIGGGKAQHGEIRQTVFHAQVRSALRPKKPCGRKKMISRNTTKMAVFCNCVGSTSVDNCCTRPMVSPPQ